MADTGRCAVLDVSEVAKERPTGFKIIMVMIAMMMMVMVMALSILDVSEVAKERPAGVRKLVIKSLVGSTEGLSSEMVLEKAAVQTVKAFNGEAFAKLQLIHGGGWPVGKHLGTNRICCRESVKILKWLFHTFPTSVSRYLLTITQSEGQIRALRGWSFFALNRDLPRLECMFHGNDYLQDCMFHGNVLQDCIFHGYHLQVGMSTSTTAQTDPTLGSRKMATLGARFFIR